MGHMFIDSHCHLDFPEFQSRLPEVLANMEAAKVSHALCVSVDIPDFPNVLKLAQEHNNLFASVGVHPDYEDTPEPSVDFLVDTASAHSKIVAIGETGLDYYRMGDRSYESMEWQRQRFRTHIRAALKAKKPLIIHTRSASIDTIQIMKDEGADGIGGVMHCFTESWAVAEAALEMGFYISFSGIVTFKNAKDLKEVAQRVPLDRMLVETDSPFLAPTPHRGALNTPAQIANIVRFIADIRGVDPEHVAEVTAANTLRVFGSFD